MAERRSYKWVAIACTVVLLLALVSWVYVRTHRATWAANRAHDRALALWESKEPTSYSYNFASCDGFCAYCPIHVVVRRGAVTEVQSANSNCPETDRSHAPTIEKAFTWASAYRSQAGIGRVDIRYDPTWGFPASVNAYCEPVASDCGEGFGISDFTVVTPAR
jgi:hypothetical protein